MTEPARPTRAEPNDRYDGPILPGQRWRSRGTSKHQFLLYTVLRFNGRSVKAVVEGHAHHGGKVYNIPEASWRGNYNLHKQAPDYDPARDYQADPQPDPIEEAILEAKVHQEAFVFGNTASAPNAPMWPDERREPGTVKSVTERTLVPPTRAGVLELLNVVEQNVREEREKMLAQNPPTIPEPAEPAEPAEPEPNTRIAVDVPSPANAMSAWIEGGRQMVEALTSELASVTTKRDALQEQVSALDLQLNLIRGQRDQIEAAVLSAIAISENKPPSPAQPAPPTPPTPPAVNAAGRSIGPGGRFTSPPGKVTQKDWVLSRLVPGQVLRIADLRDAFVTEYPMPSGVATQNISSILGYQLKARDPRFPAVERTYPGAYRALA